MNKELDCAIIGNLAFNRDITPEGEQISFGGSAYYAAIGASKFSRKIGIVSRVGCDFDLRRLTSRNIDTKGVAVIPGGKTSRFTIIQHEDSSRDFESYMGVNSEVDPSIFPETYSSTKYIHLATSLPDHYIIWLNNLHSRIFSSTTVSIDTFETYVMQYPDITREAIKMAGMIFMNQEELRVIKQFGDISFSVPLVLKRGPLGAVYIDKDKTITIPAPKVKVIDTTGAGDVLAGTFLALRAQGTSIDEALRLAVNNASQSITNFGVEHI